MSEEKPFEVSADVGGTFTDLVLRTRGVTIEIFKSSTTPDNIAVGIMNGIAIIAERRGLDTREFLRRCKSFACGTTIATNALLEGKVARTGLICTEGFRETLLIREGGKSDPYDLYMDYPKPFIPRHLTLGVKERINAEGGVELPLDPASVADVLAQFTRLGVEAIAVSLLWSIANPDHERRVGAMIHDIMPGIPYSLSHEVNPALREYRRASATAIDAALKPLVQRRIAEIETALSDAGFSGVLTFITSNGGRTTRNEVVNRPIYLCLSGPAAAPQAGCRLARQERVESGNILTTDMGGTSFEVSVSVDWKSPMHREATLAGHLLGVPSIEVKSIGAGGGSIAWVDAGGFVHIGPESAGAFPGPACYGRGGTRPTVTDANLVRGLLAQDGFADGQMRLDLGAAQAAILQHVALPLGMSVEEAASLICLAAEQNMVAAIQDITIKRGVDPRNFTLVSGGAAGGLHTAMIAREMRIKRVLFPRVAGVLSAYGIMTGDIKMGFAKSLFAVSSAFDHDKVNALLGELAAEGATFLDRMQIANDRRKLGFTTEARYAGQIWQLTLDLSAPVIRPDDLAQIVESFHQLHERFYSVRADHDPVEFTEWAVEASGIVEAAGADDARAQDAGKSAAVLDHRRCYLKEAGGHISVPVYGMDRLRPGDSVKGPALIQDRVTTYLVPAQASGTYTRARGLMVTL